MSRFQNDHPVDWCQGRSRPPRAKVMSALVDRVRWLSVKVEQRAKLLGNISPNYGAIREMLCLVRAAELIDELRLVRSVIVDAVSDIENGEKERALASLRGYLAEGIKGAMKYDDRRDEKEPSL